MEASIPVSVRPWTAPLSCTVCLLFSSMSPLDQGVCRGNQHLQFWTCLFVRPLAFRKAENLQNGFYLHFLSFFFYSVLGIKPRALHMLGKSSTTELHPRLLIHIFQNLIHAHVFWQILFVCYKTRQRKFSLRWESFPPEKGQADTSWHHVLYTMAYCSYKRSRIL